MRKPRGPVKRHLKRNAATQQESPPSVESPAASQQVQDPEPEAALLPVVSGSGTPASSDIEIDEDPFAALDDEAEAPEPAAERPQSVYRSRRAAGLCTACGGPATGKARCAKCASDLSARRPHRGDGRGPTGEMLGIREATAGAQRAEAASREVLAARTHVYTEDERRRLESERERENPARRVAPPTQSVPAPLRGTSPF